MWSGCVASSSCSAPEELADPGHVVNRECLGGTSKGHSTKRRIVSKFWDSLQRD